MHGHASTLTACVPFAGSCPASRRTSVKRGFLHPPGRPTGSDGLSGGASSVSCRLLVLDQAADGPYPAYHLVHDGDFGLVGLHAPLLREVRVSLAEPLVGLVADGLDVRRYGLPVAQLLHGRVARAGPGHPLDEDGPAVRIAGLGDGAPGPAFRARALPRHRAEPVRYVAPSPEAVEIAYLRGKEQRAEPIDALEEGQGVHIGLPARRIAQLDEHPIQGPDPLEVLLDGLDAKPEGRLRSGLAEVDSLHPRYVSPGPSSFDVSG